MIIIITIWYYILLMYLYMALAHTQFNDMEHADAMGSDDGGDNVNFS